MPNKHTGEGLARKLGPDGLHDVLCFLLAGLSYKEIRAAMKIASAESFGNMCNLVFGISAPLGGNMRGLAKARRENADAIKAAYMNFILERYNATSIREVNHKCVPH